MDGKAKHKEDVVTVKCHGCGFTTKGKGVQCPQDSSLKNTLECGSYFVPAFCPKFGYPGSGLCPSPFFNKWSFLVYNLHRNHLVVCV